MDYWDWFDDEDFWPESWEEDDGPLCPRCGEAPGGQGWPYTCPSCTDEVLE